MCKRMMDFLSLKKSHDKSIAQQNDSDPGPRPEFYNEAKKQGKVRNSKMEKNGDTIKISRKKVVIKQKKPKAKSTKKAKPVNPPKVGSGVPPKSKSKK